jgi:quinol monooxygenase YgiN
MIVVNGVFESDAKSIDAIKSALAEMETLCKAENGCDDYTFSVELNDPNVIRLTEKWDDIEALRTHLKQPHMSIIRDAMSKHPPTSSKVSFFDTTEIDPPR